MAQFPLRTVFWSATVLLLASFGALGACGADDEEPARAGAVPEADARVPLDAPPPASSCAKLGEVADCEVDLLVNGSKYCFIGLQLCEPGEADTLQWSACTEQAVIEEKLAKLEADGLID